MRRATTYLTLRSTGPTMTINKNQRSLGMPMLICMAEMKMIVMVMMMWNAAATMMEIITLASADRS